MLTITLLSLIGVFILFLIIADRKSLFKNKDYNWVGSSPSGYWSMTKQPISFSFLFFFVVIGTIWMLVSTPFRDTAIIYLFFQMIVVINYVAEKIAPKKMKILAFIAIGKKNIRSRLVAGSLLGLIAVPIGLLIPMQTSPVSLEGGILTIIGTGVLTAVVVGWSEEGLIHSVVLPTMSEQMGVIPALIGSSAFFSILHITLPIHGDITINSSFLIFSFAFSLIAGALTIWKRTVIYAFSMHISYNAGVFIVHYWKPLLQALSSLV